MSQQLDNIVLPPANPELEQAVLGSILIDPVEAMPIASSILTKMDFYMETNGLIFQAIMELHHGGFSIDLVTVSEKLRQQGIIEEIIDSLTDMVIVVPTSFHIESYCTQLRAISLRRNMIRVAQKLATGAYDESTELEEITTQAMGELANCGTDFGRHGVIAASEYAAAVLEDYEAEQDGGLTLGFPMLDSVLTFKPGDLFIVASRPGMGKTGLVNRISLNQLKVGVRVLQFTIEMTGKQLVSRMANDLSSTSISATRHKSLTPADQQRFYSAVGQIATWPLTVTYGPLSPALVRRDLTRHISRYGKPGLVIVDHLHLMTPDNPRGMSREQQIGQISNQLKGIALAFDVPMLVAAQMNRANEVRVGREPELSDLRDSGSLEQDSDLVVFIHRDGYYDELADPGQAAVLIRKNRWGAAPHTVPLFWLAESGTFRNLDNRQVPQASHLEKSSQKYNGDAAKAKPLHF